MSEAVSRDEFAMLRETVSSNQARLDEIDHGGTRGVAVLGVQLTEVVKDVADLRNDLLHHRREHRRAEDERRRSRRWVITSAVAVVAVIETPLFWIIYHMHA